MASGPARRRRVLLVLLAVGLVGYLLLAVVYILFGGDRVPSAVFYNNSRQRLVVHAGPGSYALEPGAETVAEYTALGRPFSVGHAGGEWRYAKLPVRGINRRFAYYQLEEGGAVLVLPPVADRPPLPYDHPEQCERLAPEPEG